MVTFDNEATKDGSKYFSAWNDGEKVGSFYLGKDKEWTVNVRTEGGYRYANSEEAAKGIFFKLFNKGQTPMLSGISSDVKGFITDNRQIIYWMALIFLLDHFFFQGAFRDRLKGMAEKMIGKVEKQIEAK